VGERRGYFGPGGNLGYGEALKIDHERSLFKRDKNSRHSPGGSHKILRAWIKNEAEIAEGTGGGIVRVTQR